MNYEDWVKMFQNPSNINWAEPLTEEEKIKIENQLPKIAQVLMQEQKQLRQMKKLADKFERVASAKDSETSKERMKIRLRKKLADKKEVMVKDGISHLCTEECERRQKKRAKKLAAQRKLDAELKEAEELLRRNREEEDDDDLLLFDPEPNNEEEEKEIACQHGEGAENNERQNDEEVFHAVVQHAIPQPREYIDSTYTESNLAETQHIIRFNMRKDQTLYDDDQIVYENDYDADGEDDEKISDLQMKFLAMSQGPPRRKKMHKQKPGPKSFWSTKLDVSDDFSKFLNKKYHF